MMHRHNGWRSRLCVLPVLVLTSTAAVGIGTTARAAASDEDDGRRAVVKIERPREGGLPAEIGSGFFVSPAGHILTAAHVLLESDESDEVVRRRALHVQLFGTS